MSKMVKMSHRFLSVDIQVNKYLPKSHNITMITIKPYANQ